MLSIGSWKGVLLFAIVVSVELNYFPKAPTAETIGDFSCIRQIRYQRLGMLGSIFLFLMATCTGIAQTKPSQAPIMASPPMEVIPQVTSLPRSLSEMATPAVPVSDQKLGPPLPLPPCCQAAENDLLAESALRAEIASQAPRLEEKLGITIPLETRFVDENGKECALKDLVTRPTILALVFYTCPVVCNLVQSGIVEAVKQVSLKPGTDFNIISLSIDENDTPANAAGKKRDYLAALGPQFPEASWKFLSGRLKNIRVVSDSVGYFFQRTARGIVHPVVIMFLSPQGKLVRYLYGTKYLPLQVSLALSEANEGRVGGSIQGIVSFCFSYDTAGKRYVLNITRISGILVLLFGAIFLFLLLRKGKSLPREK